MQFASNYAAGALGCPSNYTSGAQTLWGLTFTETQVGLRPLYYKLTSQIQRVMSLCDL